MSGRRRNKNKKDRVNTQEDVQIKKLQEQIAQLEVQKHRAEQQTQTLLNQQRGQPPKD